MTLSLRALRHWLSRWAPGEAPHPLSLWGKLPTHADYLHHAAGAGIARDWQDWLARFSPPPRRSQTAGWMNLAPPPSDLVSVPVAFVLPPGTLAFTGHRYVAGVMASSFDSVGRPHPLVAWRCVDAQWLNAQAAPGLPWWHAQAQLLEWHAHLADTQEDEAQGDHVVWNWPRLCDLAEQLDAAPPADASALLAWLSQRLPLLQEPRTPLRSSWPPLMPPSHSLHGVRHLPWARWPEGEHGAARRAAFWQQDGDGGIVAADHTLAGLLGS